MKQLLISVMAALLMPIMANAANILKFDTMYGVDGPFVGSTQIRNVLGDELPWDIKSAKGFLATDGRLHINVRGLVFSNDPIVPANLRGINDEKEFRALVSCLSESDGKITTVNVMTAGFPATRSGNSNIRATVKLPKACLAPIIFVVAGSEDKWFAVTGAEMESTPSPK